MPLLYFSFPNTVSVQFKLVMYLNAFKFNEIFNLISKPYWRADWFCLGCLILVPCAWLCSHSSLHISSAFCNSVCVSALWECWCVPAPGVTELSLFAGCALGIPWGQLGGHRASHFHGVAGQQQFPQVNQWFPVFCTSECADQPEKGAAV